MATEVLRPQDLLVERFRVPQTSCPRRRSFPANGSLTHLDANRRQHRKTSPKPDKRRFNAAAETKRSSHGGVSDVRQRVEVSGGGPVMGQVTLLRRGESLSSLASKVSGGSAEAPTQKPVDDLAVLGTVRIGPDLPEMVPKQIRLGAPSSGDIYAGSAFFSSPSPRSVPLPSFFNKRDSNDCQSEPFDDGATRDLRRLLRLE
ncbi:UNVERIFIED_CONTAM: hypothetical protein Sradi_2540600 [Sesamum radiatum]|uniref:Uncharacterized protein n=1 Tax=Sesamum radiatum TaxID=300843 RepID=A0AAW2SL51_SESRA